MTATPDQARSHLRSLVERHREDYAGLSRMIGRAPHYLARHVRAGTPRQLRDSEQRTLALYFRVDPAELGAPPIVVVEYVPEPLALPASAQLEPDQTRRICFSETP